MSKWIGYEYTHALIDRNWCVMRRGGHVGESRRMHQIGWRVFATLKDAAHDEARRAAADLQAAHDKREEETS
jgi:hypothetical protein